MKRALIITYYWPPSAGPGVQRWLKFVKYLRDYDWEPVVFTPDNPEVPAKDENLLKEIPKNLKVLKIPASEPYKFYRKLTGSKEGATVGFTSTEMGGKIPFTDIAARWIRGNFFIPDARKGFVKPAVEYLLGFLSTNHVDVIITTGPPHSMHLIGMELKKRTGISWLADFRDPWTGIDFYDDLLLTRWADKKHQYMEWEVLSSADVVLTVGKKIGEELKKKGAKQTEVITNGYDPKDFKNYVHTKKTDAFTILHSGSLIPSRNPYSFWEALNICCREEDEFMKDLRVLLIGKNDSGVKDTVTRYAYAECVRFIDYVSHDKIIQKMSDANILILLINKTRNAEGFLTGKLFEYLAAKRPILSIGPLDGDAALLIEKTKAGITCDFSDTEAIKAYLLAMYREWKRNGMTQVKSVGIEEYSRKELTAKLAEILNQFSP